MNVIKKYLGIIWMILGPLSLYYLFSTAWREMEKKPVMDTKIQWGVFIAICIPIAIGLIIFGWYALQGEYEKIED
ncbi:DUF6814 family protein [Parasediminibacterium paludis]|uniref:DUF6814 family protein n=1 Tax=Parasediminibacterium paludis TaxID=908966 RepID=A0ABV8PZ67_9BACT